MAKFRFVDGESGFIEEVVMSDCHTVEDAMNTRFGSAVPPHGVDVTIIEESEVDGEATASSEATGTTKHEGGVA